MVDRNSEAASVATPSPAQAIASTMAGPRFKPLQWRRELKGRADMPAEPWLDFAELTYDIARGARIVGQLSEFEHEVEFMRHDRNGPPDADLRPLFSANDLEGLNRFAAGALELLMGEAEKMLLWAETRADADAALATSRP